MSETSEDKKIARERTDKAVGWLVIFPIVFLATAGVTGPLAVWAGFGILSMPWGLMFGLMVGFQVAKSYIKTMGESIR